MTRPDQTNLPALALAWHMAGRKVAIATVVDTWGSAPRGVGSMMVVDDTGAMEGSVSGGCVEGAVITEAMDALGTGTARLLAYGVSDDDAFAVGLACGGRIRVLVEPVGPVLPVAVLRDLVAALDARKPVAYVTSLLQSRPAILGDAAQYRAGIDPDGDRFVAIHTPGLRIVIVGAVHIAQPLVVMARACGYGVYIVDPRGSFGSAARFPEDTIIDTWPDEALQTLGLDARTAVVTLTHDPKLDDPALYEALRSNAFYVGCLGSTRTHGHRVARLRSTGVGEADIARIHGPVGLDIGGRHPSEIAVSIMAQITQILHKPA